MTFIEQDGGITETGFGDTSDPFDQLWVFLNNPLRAVAKAIVIIVRVLFGIARLSRVVSWIIGLFLHGKDGAFIIENGNANRLRAEINR